VAGEWQNNSTIVLSAPTNLEFNTAQVCTANITAGDLDLGGGAGTDVTAVPTASTITFTVVPGGASSVATTIQFENIQLRPTVQNCSTAGAGDRSDIQVTCSGGNNLNVATNVVDVTVVAGALNKIGFSTEPITTTAGQALVPAVALQDQCSNTVASAGPLTITLAIENNPGNAALLGTRQLATSSGVATWTGGENLRINVEENGYTLRATTDTLAHVTSAAFNINAAVKSAVRFVQHPSDAVAGVVIAPDVTVEIVYALEPHVGHRQRRARPGEQSRQRSARRHDDASRRQRSGDL